MIEALAMRVVILQIGSRSEAGTAIVVVQIRLHPEGPTSVVRSSQREHAY